MNKLDNPTPDSNQQTPDSGKTARLVGLFLAATVVLNTGCSYTLYPRPHRHIDENYDRYCDNCGVSLDRVAGSSGSGYHYNGRYYPPGRGSYSDVQTTSSNHLSHGVSQGAKGGIGSSGAHSGG